MSFVCLHINLGSHRWQGRASRGCARKQFAASPKQTRVHRATCFCTAHKHTPDLLVIGAGAAGLTAAYFAAQQGAQVTVLEKNQESGRKILISGGTRCNVLPSCLDISQDYFTESSRSAIKAVFATWSLEQCKEWLESRQHIGLPLAHEANDSKYFPVSNSAKEVRDKLLSACQTAGVKFRYQAKVEGLQQLNGSSGWQCKLASGTAMEAQSIVLASGGLSYPHLGTEGDGHRIVKQLGHSMNPTYPALTPLLGAHPGNSQLAGLSLYGIEAAAHGPKSGKKGKRSSSRAQRRGMLFTHRGFSGPAVLDLSHHKVRAMLRGTPQPELKINWTGINTEAWQDILQTAGGAAVHAVLHKHGLPKRLAEALCQELNIVGTPAAQLRKADRLRLLELLTAYRLDVTGHGGYAKAEVTGGGVPLAEINCSTMESKRLAGLYLCGEVCDVFGRIGGFNFYWAWLSGRLAGTSAAAQSLDVAELLQQ